MPFVLLNKPFRVLCQFSDGQNRPTLAGLVDTPEIYPCGRLDYDSEGLVILTDDGRLQARISEPRHKLDKHYWVQVEGAATQTEMAALLAGVSIRNRPARALAADVIAEPDALWSRIPPIRVRKDIPTSWLDIVINTGQNRQVRRMTAAVGLPTLRLIRHRIGPWSLDGLAPGECRELQTESAWKTLKNYRPLSFD